MAHQSLLPHCIGIRATHTQVCTTVGATWTSYSVSAGCWLKSNFWQKSAHLPILMHTDVIMSNGLSGCRAHCISTLSMTHAKMPAVMWLHCILVYCWLTYCSLCLLYDGFLPVSLLNVSLESLEGSSSHLRDWHRNLTFTVHVLMGALLTCIAALL